MAKEVEVIINEHFERLEITDKEMNRKVNKILRKVLGKAKRAVSSEARAVIEHDPRAAYKAVKMAIYKRMTGGSISILQSRKASSNRVHVERSSTRTSSRGGNRLPRSQRTEQIDSYYGADRGFILRFLNAGTSQRTTRFGNRGSISAHNWFGPVSKQQVELAADEFAQLIDTEIRNTKV